MSLIWILVLAAVLALILWVAPKLPAPGPLIIYVLVSVILIVFLLKLLGLITAPILVP